MSAWAKPGVKCVCVDPNPLWEKTVWFADTPVLNGIYTIREVVDGGTAVLLQEIRNRTCLVEYEVGLGFGEPCFGVWRFKPLITKTQSEDIALFRQLLAGLPVGEDA